MKKGNRRPARGNQTSRLIRKSGLEPEPILVALPLCVLDIYKFTLFSNTLRIALPVKLPPVSRKGLRLLWFFCGR